MFNNKDAELDKMKKSKVILPLFLLRKRKTEFIGEDRQNRSIGGLH